MKFFKLFFFFVICLFIVFPVFSQYDDPIPDDWCQQNPSACEVDPYDCPPNCPPPPVCIGSTSECAADGGEGGGTGVTASMFYCSQPGSPTGINVKHQCLLDFQAEYSMPGYDYCRYGGAYDLGAGCTYYRDPCRIEDFGATGGACRGEKWRDIGSCEVVGEGCSGPPDSCSRCVYHPRIDRGEESEDAFCALEVNDCCGQTSEDGCHHWTLAGSCWWNCASGAVVTPTSTPTPTPTFTPTPTPTNTPTPTPVASASWLKFQNLSIHAYQTPPNIPENPEQFDESDTTNRYLADNSTDNNSPGLVSYSDGIIADISITGWKTNVTYTRSTPLLSGGFKNYIQTRKEYTALTTAPTNLGDVDLFPADGIYYYAVPEENTLEINTAPTKKMVLVVDGDVSLAQNLTQSSGFALIVNGTLTIEPTVEEIHGIIIADVISLVASSNGLKINGNMITNELDNDRERNEAERLKPIIFTVANNQYYLDLLPYLSTVKYEWGQTE